MPRFSRVRCTGKTGLNQNAGRQKPSRVQTVDKAHVLQVKTWAFSMQWIRKLKQKTLASLFIF